MCYNVFKAKPAFNKRLALRRPFGRLRGSQNTSRACALRWNALCGVLLTHIFAALVFASQSPYSGCKNVANLERYVPCQMC
jgi:hypothetical protein